MVKLTCITGVGTFAYPWVEYAVAAVYNIVDEFIVVNAGFNRDRSRDDVPLEREGRALREIDVNGKIHRTCNVYWDKPAKGVDENDPRAYWGVRKGHDGVVARNFTIANRIAIDRGAEWILRIDADQVFYECCPFEGVIFESIRKLIPFYIAKHPSCGYMFLEHKEWIRDIYHRKKNPETSVSDGAMLWRTYPGDCHIGGCAPMIQPDTMGPPIYWLCTAHLKGVYPPDWPMEKIKEHIRDRQEKMAFISWQIHEHPFNKIRTKEAFDAEVAERVRERLARFNGYLEPANIPPPLVCEMGPLKYIKEGHPK